MRKVVTQTELNEVIMKDLSEIDLNKFPIEYKKTNLTKLIDMVWRVIEHP
jgi:hypothetical protein